MKEYCIEELNTLSLRNQITFNKNIYRDVFKNVMDDIIHDESLCDTDKKDEDEDVYIMDKNMEILKLFKMYDNEDITIKTEDNNDSNIQKLYSFADMFHNVLLDRYNFISIDIIRIYVSYGIDIMKALYHRYVKGLIMDSMDLIIKK
jgi:hypothetical protein